MTRGGTSVVDDPGEPYWPPISREKAAATAIAIALLALVTRTSDGFVFVLDHANLAFHEAGHLIYGIFGDTLGLYGGTLGQLTFPAILVGVSIWRRQVPGTALGVAWIAQNLINIARYCADAQVQELPLVGGGDHDWTNILSRWHALHRELRVAAVLRGIAWSLFLGSLGFVGWRWWRSRGLPG
jgi:hypothetical protein